MCAQPGLDGAVVSQNKNSTVKIVLLGREGVCVNGDVQVPIGEELVCVCRTSSSCPEVSEVLLQVRVSNVE